MNGDALELSKQLWDMQQTLSQQISSLQMVVAEMNGRFSTEIKAVRETHEAFRTELLGDGGRVANLEAGQKRNERRQWVHTAIIIPVTMALRAVAAYFGWHI